MLLFHCIVLLSLFSTLLAQTCNLYGCPCVPPTKYVAPSCSTQYNLPEYTVSGTHYEIGYSIGTQLKSQITNYILSQTTYCVPTYENLGYVDEINADPFGVFATNFRALKALAHEMYPQYVQELQGMIDATGIRPEYLWAMNFQDEMFVTYLGGQTLNTGRNGNDGCSYIFYRDVYGNVVAGHNEDGDPTMDRGMVLLHVNVADPSTNEYYNYTVGYYLGMLPGWSFGFNSYGMIMDLNSLYPLQIGAGLGTAWTSRDLMSAKNMSDAIAKCTPYGTSLGASFNLGSVSEGLWINVEGQPNGANFMTNHTVGSGGFHHFNNYLTYPAASLQNNVWYHESPSTKHREVNLARLVQNNGGNLPSTVSQVAAIIGDTVDTETSIDGNTYVFWRRDPNYDYAFTHASYITTKNTADNFATVRIWGTGVNPNTCPNAHATFTVQKLQ